MLLNPYRFGTAGGTGTPPNTLTGCTFWLDATDTSTLLDVSNGSVVTTDGSPVGMAKSKVAVGGVDQCGYQATAGARPVLKTGIVNGKSVLRFDGTDDVYTTNTRSGDTAGGTTLGGTLFSYTQKVAIFGLSIPAADAAQANVYQNDAVLSDAGAFILLHVSNLNATDLTMHAYNWDTNADVATHVLTKNTFAVVTVKHQGGNINIRINGGSWATVATGSTNGGAGMGIINIARAASSNRFMQMDLVHMALYNSAPSDAGIYGVEQWIANEMGLTI